MALNTIPNSTTIDTFIEKYGRVPEMKNFDDVCKIADLIRDNHWKAMDTTAWGGYYMDAAKAAIIAYWKAKRLAKVT
jgi:hypothetical protein